MKLFPKKLEVGSKDSNVLILQMALVALKLHPEIIADGEFGPKTAEGVKAFQARAELEPTGVFDEGTRQALLEALHVDESAVALLVEAEETAPQSS